MLYELSSPHILITVLYVLYVLGMVLILLLDEKPPQSTAAWILSVIFLPFLGLLLYLFAGVNWKRHKILQQRPEEKFRQQLQDVLKRQYDFLADPESPLSHTPTEYKSDVQKTVRLLLNSNHTPVTLHNHFDIFDAGKDFFDALKTDLQAAQKHIHMEFFIWKSDALGWEIGELLAQKAQAGVEVRLLFDGVGCFWKMSRRYKRFLKQSGIEFRIFLDPLNPVISNYANYLNHRKIVVIDGHLAYMGGMNLAEEYITGGKRFDSWRDTGLRFEGEVAQQLQTIFATDWFNSSGKWLSDSRYFPELPLLPDKDRSPIQIACSGPDSEWFSIKQLLFNLIINADQEVYLQSPYFIPDEGIATAMETAALSGVQVHLMLTGIPDKKIPYWVAESYFANILKAGCRIYRYQKGFLHCKTLSVDGHIASVGTCNLDLRSFELDYEVNAVIYDRHLAQTLKEHFERDQIHCQEITLQEVQNMGLLRQLRNNALRMLSPLL